MGERRKRKPLWDSEDESKHLSGMREYNSRTGKDRHNSHGSGRYHEVSDCRSTVSRESRDHSGWRFWESIEHPGAPINSSFKNSPEGKEIGGGKGYHKNVSPGFDGIELHTNDHTRGYDRSHLQRYMGRGRSRSRSRSRNRGRSRSRSLSRGRERVRLRGRSDGNGNDHRRSRSPITDYKRQSYGSSDKRRGPEKSSQTCRDFTSGNCRRGSQCRFFHPDNTSHRGDNLVENDTVESWRSRADDSRFGRRSSDRSGFESRNDEQFPNRSRSSAPCKDFMRGKCRWGETCRFSHSTRADSFGRGSRNSSFDKDKSGQPICKYFAAGKCDKDNCRFSHEGSNHTNLEGLHDKSNWSNAPKLDDAMILDTQKPTGRDEIIVTDISGTDDIGNRQNDDKWMPGGSNISTGDTGNRQNDDGWKPWGSTGDTSNRQNGDAWKPQGSTGDTGNRQNDDSWKPEGSTGDTGNRKSDDTQKAWGSAGDRGNRQNDDAWKPLDSTGDTDNGQNTDGWGAWGDSFKNESNYWGIQEPMSNFVNSEKQPAVPGESRSYGGGTEPAKSTAEDSIANKQDEIVNLHESIVSNENEGPVKALQQNVSPASHIQQQHCRVIENSPMNSLGSAVLGKVKDPRLSNHPILLPGESLNQNSISMYPCHSSVSSGSTTGQVMLGTNPSNNLNGPETYMVNPFNVQVHTQNNQTAFQSPRLLEANGPQLISNLPSYKHSDQVTISRVTTAGQQVNVGQSLENEKSQAYSGIHVSDSRGVFPPLPSTTDHLPLVNTAKVQPNPGAVSVDLLISVGNSCEITDNLTHVTELNDQMPLKRPSPSSVLGTEFDGSKAKPPESPKQEEKIAANLGVGEETKGIQENKPSEAMDSHVKPEDGRGNKDEKGIRLFKNALIEFVKEILKPTWKEGRMSREVHKTIVKKVVDKVCSTIQVEHVPKTQDKVEQYLSVSKPKITKLVQAYVEHCQRGDG